jgi:hypothetical protein
MVILGTQDTGHRTKKTKQNTTQQRKQKDEQHGPTKQREYI